MTGAWDDPAVRAAVAATNRVRVNHGQEPLVPVDEVMAAAGVAAATAAMAMAEQLERQAEAEGTEEGARMARRARQAAEAPALGAKLLEEMEGWGVERRLALSILVQAWNMGWRAGFRDAEDGTLSREPFPDN